ncbi:hypothetical protein [Lentibacillus salinarum]|uniref:Uncharacterized protein n=1 Tax=Lentibacillus salinarum TaxID=446820 RepID=A0ABW3ZYT1_9BACI
MSHLITPPRSNSTLHQKKTDISIEKRIKLMVNAQNEKDHDIKMEVDEDV